jgi:hypothetical protein
MSCARTLSIELSGSVTPCFRRNSGALRPGLIVVIGVAAIALVLTAIVLLPPPNIRTVAECLIPPDTLIISELNHGDLIGMSGTTDRSLIDVDAFYRERFRLTGRAIVGSGITSWSERRLLGGFRSGVTMPDATNGFVILLRDKKELVAVIAPRATNESLTYIEIFCERKPAAQASSFSRGNRAARFAPPDTAFGSSASSLLIDGAMSTTLSAPTNLTAYYFTNVFRVPLPSLTNWTVSPAGGGMFSIPKRTGAESATFLLRSNINETVLIHCFRSGTSTQTHVLVGCATR